MREEIKKILGLVSNSEICNSRIDKLTNQILSLIAKSLPEKKLEDCSCFACSTNNEDCYCHSRVYNQMLAEVKKGLGI